MVLRARRDAIDPMFLPFFMQSDVFMSRALQISVGSLSPTINWTALAGEEFSLPPLDQQRRIVQVLSACDSAVEALSRLQLSAHQVRGAVLERFFPTVGLEVNRRALRTLQDAGHLKLQTGPFGTMLSSAEYKPAGWPVVNPTHIRNGRIKHVDGPYVDEATAARLSNYRMQHGDILLARKGEIDKATLVTPKESGWVVGSDCILIRANDAKILPAYLLMFLQSPSTGRLLRSLAHGTVMPGLNEGMLSRLEIPLRPMTEQVTAAKLVQGLDEAVGDLVGRRDALEGLKHRLRTAALDPRTAKSS